MNPSPKAKAGAKGNKNDGGPDVVRDDDIDCATGEEFAELDNMKAVDGYGSEDELARRLIVGLPSLRDAHHQIEANIDMENYSVTVGSDSGLAITYARTTQRNRNRGIFSEPHAKLRKHNMRTLSNSFSALYTSNGFAKYVEEAIAWQQWHASWIYGGPVSAKLRKDMATPQVIAQLEGVDLTRAEDEDRSGIISWAETSGNSSDSSTEDGTSEEESL